MDRPGRPPGPRPAPVVEYYYRPRPMVRSDRPAVRAEEFLSQTGGVDGRLRLRFTCLTPVHIGTGITGLEGGRAILLTARSGEAPIIPGTALKGALRTVGEVLARSCPDQRCRACYTCLLFGALGYRARVSFGPAVPDGAPPRPLGFLLPTRSSRGAMRDDRKIRFYNHHRAQPDPRGAELVETIPAGATLVSDVNYQNLRPHALGCLLLVSGAAPEHAFYHKIGAGRSQGLGSVKVEIVSHTVRTVGRTVPSTRDDPAPDAGELVRAYLEAEKAQDTGATITDNLAALIERSRRLEVSAP